MKNSKFDLILCIWTWSKVCHHTPHMFCFAPGLHYEIYIPKIPGLPNFLMLPVDDTTVWTAAVLILRRASVNKQQSVRHLFHPQYKNDMSLYLTTSNRHFTSLSCLSFWWHTTTNTCNMGSAHSTVSSVPDWLWCNSCIITFVLNNGTYIPRAL